MLYMIFDKKENMNLVKVGKARNLGERAAGYTTHNPTAEMRWKSQGTGAEEQSARKQIMDMGGERVIKRSEWLVVDNALYNLLYEQGFSALKGFSRKNPRRY